MKALRAEFAGDRPAALAAYRAWSERPRHERLGSYLLIPNPEAERFVRWRLAVLSEGAAP